MRDTTLCYVFHDGKVLLQKKAAGMFGEGRWNGPGGKIEENESPEKAAIREVREETDLSVSDLQEMGILRFSEDTGDSLLTHVFVTDMFSGEVKHSEEGRLEWFEAGSIPYDEMWEDDIFLFPLLLSRERFIGHFVFTKGFKRLVEHNIERL